MGGRLDGLVSWCAPRSSSPTPDLCQPPVLGPGWERNIAGRRRMEVEQSVISLEAILEFLPSPDTGSDEVSGSACTCPQPLWGDRCYLFSLRQEGGERVVLVLMWGTYGAVLTPATAYLTSSTYSHLLLTCHLNKQGFYRALSKASLQLPALRGCFKAVWNFKTFLSESFKEARIQITCGHLPDLSPMTL